MLIAAGCFAGGDRLQKIRRRMEMNTIETIYRRRAVKHFDDKHSLTESEERKLLEATIQSPTSF